MGDTSPSHGTSLAVQSTSERGGGLASVRGVAVFGVLALSSVFVVASATPAAAAITVTVDPSTGLADGQPVTITGEGFDPNVSVGTAECTAAVATSRNTNDCDLSNSRTVQADSSGKAVILLRVSAPSRRRTAPWTARPRLTLV